VTDDPADDHHLAVAAAVEIGQAAVGLAPQLVANRVQRVLGHVQAEHFFLDPEHSGLSNSSVAISG